MGPSGLLQAFYYEYDNDGRVNQVVREDGKVIYYDYESEYGGGDRIAHETWRTAGGTTLYAFVWGYNFAGDRNIMFDGVLTPVQTDYYYNSLRQLTQVNATGGARTYFEYTDDGNLDTRHDASGWTYFHWNNDDTLRWVQEPDGGYLVNQYDAARQRSNWYSDTDGNPLVHDGAKLLAERAVGGGSAGRVYVNEGSGLGDQLVLQCAGGTKHYPLYDALGSVTGLTGSNGALTGTWTYDAFGRTLGRTGTTVTPFQFVGGYGYYTTSTGLIHAWHRWYDPQIGKWLSQDPIGSPGGNPYTYVGDLPTVWVDPMGLQPNNPFWNPYYNWGNTPFWNPYVSPYRWSRVRPTAPPWQGRASATASFTPVQLTENWWEQYLPEEPGRGAKPWSLGKSVNYSDALYGSVPTLFPGIPLVPDNRKGILPYTPWYYQPLEFSPKKWTENSDVLASDWRDLQRIPGGHHNTSYPNCWRGWGGYPWWAAPGAFFGAAPRCDCSTPHYQGKSKFAW